MEDAQPPASVGTWCMRSAGPLLPSTLFWAQVYKLLHIRTSSAVDGVVIYLTDYQRSITERLAKVGTSCRFSSLLAPQLPATALQFWPSEMLTVCPLAHLCRTLSATPARRR